MERKISAILKHLAIVLLLHKAVELLMTPPPDEWEDFFRWMDEHKSGVPAELGASELVLLAERIAAIKVLVRALYPAGEGVPPGCPKEEL